MSEWEVLSLCLCILVGFGFYATQAEFREVVNGLALYALLVFGPFAVTLYLVTLILDPIPGTIIGIPAGALASYHCFKWPKNHFHEKENPPSNPAENHFESMDSIVGEPRHFSQSTTNTSVIRRGFLERQNRAIHRRGEISIESHKNDEAITSHPDHPFNGADWRELMTKIKELPTHPGIVVLANRAQTKFLIIEASKGMQEECTNLTNWITSALNRADEQYWLEFFSDWQDIALLEYQLEDTNTSCFRLSQMKKRILHLNNPGCVRIWRSSLAP